MYTFLVLAISACSNPDDFGLESTEFVFTEQKWQLIKMSSSWTNDEKTGDAMEWQEYYIFSPDSTFSKFRVMNGKSEEAAGTFAVVQYENDADDYLELHFESGTAIKTSCHSEPKEVLRFRSKNSIESTWNACDGLGLEYTLIPN